MLRSNWLNEKLPSTDPSEIRALELAAAGCSVEDVQRYLNLGAEDEPNPHWQHFIRKMQPGDELWSFRSLALTSADGRKASLRQLAIWAGLGAACTYSKQAMARRLHAKIGGFMARVLGQLMSRQLSGSGRTLLQDFAGCWWSTAP